MNLLGYSKIVIIEKSIKTVILATLLAFSTLTSAADYGAQVKWAEMTIRNNWYVLDAEIPIKLSPIALDALQNSISQVWELRVRLRKQRHYFWNENIFAANFRYQIRYHPLLKMYQVKQENSGKIVSFSTLHAAFNAIESIKGLKIIKQNQLQSTEKYSVAIKMQFLKEDLPLPLRPLSYFNSEWYLSSKWFQWLVQK